MSFEKRKARPLGATGRAIPKPREPGLVTVLRFGRDPLNFPGLYFKRYGDTFRTVLFGQKMVMTRDPEWITDVLVRKAQSFQKDKATKRLAELLGNGLLTNDGAAWLTHRRVVQPHFQPNQLERHLVTFDDEVRQEMGSWPSSGVLDVHEAMMRLSLRIVLRSIFGTDPDECAGFEKIMSAAMLYFEGVGGTQSPLPTWVPTTTNRRFLAARGELRARLGAIIQSARRIGRQDTLLSQLLAERETNRLSDEQLVDESITMLVVGHETSALTLCYTLSLLAKHQLIQTGLRQEIARNGVPSTIEACQRPGQLKNILTESLRLYPVAWALGREATEDVEIAGSAIKAGTQIYVHQWQAHRHPAHFPQPEEFLPGRWTEPFSKALPRHLYAPFGTGPRICIGNHFALAEMSVLLARLVENFAFTRHTTAPLQFRASISARPRDPVLLRVRRLDARSA